jgi:lipid-A-disaccharide synthase-like uncharacterized protein
MLIGPGAAATTLLAASHGGTACPSCGHEQTTGLWLMIGFLGQAVFTARFLAQWIASEKRRDSVVPVIFWWLSLAGGMILLSYAIHRQDPVITVGQSMGVFIYVRNLMLVAKGRRREARRQSAGDPDRSRGRATASRPHSTIGQPARGASREDH